MRRPRRSRTPRDHRAFTNPRTSKNRKRAYIFELEIRVARDACEAVELPRPFVLVGQGGSNIIGFDDGREPFVVDAEGVVLRSGAVYAWCRTGCCAQVPQRWASVDAAADYHGSFIVENDGIRPPNDPAGN